MIFHCNITSLTPTLAGVDHEEAGEKWRGGDAAKSTRFFVRAIDTYEEGLTKSPDSFDLAYNKSVSPVSHQLQTLTASQSTCSI